MICKVDAASKCSAAANDRAALKDGPKACNIALNEPAMLHRVALLLDRGVIQVRLGNNAARHDEALPTFLLPPFPAAT